MIPSWRNEKKILRSAGDAKERWSGIGRDPPFTFTLVVAEIANGALE